MMYAKYRFIPLEDILPFVDDRPLRAWRPTACASCGEPLCEWEEKVCVWCDAAETGLQPELVEWDD